MKSLLTGLFLGLTTSLAYAGEPIVNLEGLEGEVMACLQKLTKSSRCTEQTFIPHIVPGSEQLKTAARQIDEFLAKWLGPERIFAVHPIASKKTADIYQTNVYLIEDSSGSLMIFKYSLLKRLGQWYVYSFYINSKVDEIKAVLNDRD